MSDTSREKKILSEKEIIEKITWQNPKIGSRNQSEWTMDWWQWFYSIDENEHPSYGSSSYRMRSNDVNQGRVLASWLGKNETTSADDDKVWFLAGVQASTTAFVRSIIPEGDWQAVLVPVYVMSGSTNEFPSKSENDIKDMVTADVDSAKAGGTLSVEFDGIKVSDDKIVRINSVVDGGEGWFVVGNIAAENVAGLDVDSLKLYSDGWWYILNLEGVIGDHILHVVGKAANYGTDTTFSLTVRGPKAK